MCTRVSDVVVQLVSGIVMQGLASLLAIGALLSLQLLAC